MNLRRGQKKEQAKEYIQRRNQLKNLFSDLSNSELKETALSYTEKWLEDHGDWKPSWEICKQDVVVFFAYMVACSTEYGEAGFRRIINASNLNWNFQGITEYDIMLLFPKKPKRARQKKGRKTRK